MRAPPLNGTIVIRTLKRHSSRRMRLGCRDRDAFNAAGPGRVLWVRSLQTDLWMRRLLVTVGVMGWISFVGCESATNPACADLGTLHDEVIVISGSQFPSETAACFSPSHDCSALCAALAQSRGTGGPVVVVSCEPAEQDAATSASDAGESDAAASPGSVHMVYRTYPFCGT